MQKKRISIRKTLIGPLSLFFLILLSSAQIQQKIPEVPYVPTPEEVVAEMLKMADVGKDDVLYDLGCGDGRIVITAAKELGCRGVGIDIEPLRIEESRKNAIDAGVSERVEFILSDLFEADISRATVVTLYLLPRVNLRLRPKLFHELNPGARVVSHDFDMGKWNPDDKKILNDNNADFSPPRDPIVFDSFVLDGNWDRHTVYLWIVPANVTGVWRWTIPTISGAKQYSLELEQIFQEVQGKAYEDTSLIPVSIKNGKIEGNRLVFTLERIREKHTEQLLFDGVVRGHTMEGVVRIAGNPNSKVKWRAERVLSTFKAIDKSEK